MTMTSGLSAARLLHGGVAVARLGDDLHVGLAVDEQLQPVTDGHVIVGQQNPERRFVLSHDRASVRRGGSHAHQDGRAPARRRFDLSRRADQRRALLHARAGRSRGAVRGVRRIEPHAIVLDDQQRRESARRSRMTSDVSTRRACLATLVSASCAMRYSVVSISDGEPLVEQPGRVQLARRC